MVTGGFDPAAGYRPVTPVVHREPVRWFSVAGPDESLRRSLAVLRTLPATVFAVARQLSGRRVVFTSIALVALVAIVLWVPLPSAMQMRDWSAAAGPWLPLAFLAAHALITVFPFPRTAFTLAAGLLFGSALGVLIAVTASTISAVLAMLAVRAFDWRLSRVLAHPRMEAADEHLRRRGWPAVLSLRLIPAIPFSVINYAAGASTVRLLPDTLATMAGLLPGTAAVVILGDAMTGTVSPVLLLVSACTAGVGIAGLVYEWRMHRRHVHAQHAHHGDEISAPAA